MVSEGQRVLQDGPDCSLARQVLLDRRIGMKRYEVAGRRVLFYFDEVRPAGVRRRLPGATPVRVEAAVAACHSLALKVTLGEAVAGRAGAADGSVPMDGSWWESGEGWQNIVLL